MKVEDPVGGNLFQILPNQYRHCVHRMQFTNTFVSTQATTVFVWTTSARYAIHNVLNSGGQRGEKMREERLAVDAPST